jgi:hypothetical protein
MSVNHLHHNLLATTLGERSAEGRAECPAAIAVPTGIPVAALNTCVERSRKISTLSITCRHKLFGKVLTLE